MNEDDARKWAATLQLDERWSWANTTWSPVTSLSLDSFSTAGLGRQSVIQAAYEFHSQNPHLPQNPPPPQKRQRRSP